MYQPTRKYSPLDLDDDFQAMEDFMTWLVGRECNASAESASSTIPGTHCIVVNNSEPVYMMWADAGTLFAAANTALALAHAHPGIKLGLLCLDWIEPHDGLPPSQLFRLIDAQYLFRNHWAEILQMPRDVVVRHIERDIGDHFVHKLQTLAPGQSTASEYESLVEDIFAYLFAPDIWLYESQSQTYDRTQVRDSVFEITNGNEFWKDVKRHYAKGPTFAVEAKNFSKPAQSAAIRQLAGYLKPNGVGCFGILVTRMPVSSTAEREILLQRQGRGDPAKTILTLHDGDISTLIYWRQTRSVEACSEFLKLKLLKLLKSV